MPTFTMNCFKLPRSLYKDIESLTCKFWWGYRGDQYKTLGWLGINFVFLIVKVAWDFETSKISILLSLESRYGGFSTTRIPCSTRCFKRDTFHLAQSWMMGSKSQGHMHGRAFLRLAKSSLWGLQGVSEMVVVIWLEVIGGCQVCTTAKSSFPKNISL